MKLTLRHLAVVSAKTKGGRVPRISVIAPEAEFTINVLDPQQAPVVMTVSVSDGNSAHVREVRSFKEGLYRAVSKQHSYSRPDGPETLDELVSAISSDIMKRKGFQTHIVEMASSALRLADADILPSGMFNGLCYKELPDDHALVTAAIELTDQVVMDDDVRAEVSKWHDVMQRHINEYITVDGKTYKRCGEPIYTLHASEHGASIGICYLGENSPGRSTALSFAATARDEALAALAIAKTWVNPEREAGWPTDRDKTPEIVVFDDNHVRWRAEEQDFDRFARDCLSSLDAAIDKVRKCRNIRIPRNVYDCWLDLRDILDSYDLATSSVPVALEESLSVAIDTWRTYQEQVGDEICSVKAPSIGRVDALFQRFVDRPIDLSPVGTYSGPSLTR
jgi:hypothetical protein